MISGTSLFLDGFDKLLLLWLSLGKVPVVVFFSWFVRWKFSVRRRFIVGAEPSPGQRRREWKGALLTCSDAVLLVLVAYFGWIRLEAPTVTNVVISIAAMILWVDLWMYWTHRWMHRSGRLWAIHRHHHLSRLAEPSTALSFSAGEKLVFYTAGWIGGACVLSWFIPMSLGGITAYYTLYFVLSCLGHCNTLYFKERWIIPSPAVHALHHWKPSVNFGFYTTIYDRVFGTYAAPGSVLDAQEPHK